MISLTSPGAAPGETADGGSTAGQIEILTHALEALAAGGEWSGLEALMRRRDALLDEVGAGEKTGVYRSALESNERLLAVLRPVREAVGDELLALRRRHSAIGRYESNRNSARQRA